MEVNPGQIKDFSRGINFMFVTQHVAESSSDDQTSSRQVQHRTSANGQSHPLSSALSTTRTSPPHMQPGLQINQIGAALASQAIANNLSQVLLQNKLAQQVSV